MKRIILLIALVAMLTGCMGSVVPPGKKVIILHPSGESTIKDTGVYKSYGRDKLYFVDQKLQSFTESIQILCADGVNMSVDIKTVCCFEVDDDSIEFIKQKVDAVESTSADVDGMELSLSAFYEMTVKDIVSATARVIIGKNETSDIQVQREVLEAEVAKTVRTRLKELKYPLQITAVLIANLDYPKIVQDQREAIVIAELEDQRKAALAEATMAEAQRQAGIETELAKVRMIKAQAQADENRILADSLTPEYLSWHQLEVMENVSTEMAKGQNNVVFIMPYESISRDTLNTAMLRDSVSSINRPRVPLAHVPPVQVE